VPEERRRPHRSYRAGDWFAIFGDRATVLLPPGEKARVAALWQLLDDGADFDDALDAVLAGGLRALPGLVLLGESGDETRILVRGPARAVVTGPEGDVRLDGSGATTWVERSVPGVTRLLVDVSGDDADHVGRAGRAGEGGGADGVDELRIDGGLARVSRIDQPPYVGPAVEAQPEVVAPEVVAPAYDDDETQAIALADAPSSAAPSEDDAAADRVTERLAEDAAPRPVARLDFSTGDRVDVDRVVLVGRAPEARRFAAGEQPRLVTLASPHQEISSTHLEVRPGTGPDEGWAVLTDLGSTNGTWLVQPGGEAEELRAGLAERLRPGALIDLGDGVTIRVSGR
jgi:FHA domain